MLQHVHRRQLTVIFSFRNLSKFWIDFAYLARQLLSLQQTLKLETSNYDMRWLVVSLSNGKIRLFKVFTDEVSNFNLVLSYFFSFVFNDPQRCKLLNWHELDEKYL